MNRLTWAVLVVALLAAGYAATVTTLAQRQAVQQEPFMLSVTEAGGRVMNIPGVVYLRQGRIVGAKVTGKPVPAPPAPTPTTVTPEVPERPERTGRARP